MGKNVPLLKYILDFDIFSLNRLNFLVKRAFCRNVYFRGKFFLEKWEKILTKQFFSNISKQVGENLIMPSVEGTFLLQEIFFNWVLETAF